jgi:AcrR family transcriptional regulator
MTDSTDGRRARRERHRLAVLDAVVELFGDGHLHPPQEAVAARAGVSVASVYRYYRDPAHMRADAIERGAGRHLALLAIPDIGKGAIDVRIRRYVDSRLDFYDHAAPVLRALVTSKDGRPRLLESYEAARQRARSQTDLHFAPELRAMAPSRRRAASVAIDTLFQVQSFDHLHLDLGLTLRQMAPLLRETLAALLDGGGHVNGAAPGRPARKGRSVLIAP